MNETRQTFILAIQERSLAPKQVVELRATIADELIALQQNMDFATDERWQLQAVQAELPPGPPGTVPQSDSDRPPAIASSPYWHNLHAQRLKAGV